MPKGNLMFTLFSELNAIKWKLSNLEHRVADLESKLGEATGLQREGKEITEEDEEKAKVHAGATIALIAQARRAVFGYTMLVRSLGLGENVNDLTRQVETMITMMIRLQQTIVMTELALTALEAGHPYLALFRGVVAGGTAIASIMYGSKMTGG